MASRKKAAPPERATRRQYTSEQREAVLADVRVIGVCATAAKHGVAQSCVSRWAKTARVSRAAPVEGHPAEATPTLAPPPAPPVTAKGDTARAVAKTVAKSGVARLYTPSQKAEVLEYASTHSITEASNKFGISRFSIYDWRRRVTKAAAGKGSSPTRGPAPRDIETTRDREILAEWHKHPGLGPSQIVNQLRRAGIKVAVHTARRVMEDAGYRPPKVKREPHDERYEAVRPNHLWHLDFVQRFINRVSTFTLIVIDDYSRFVVGHGVDEGAERADMVIKTFEEAVARHGRPERIIDDKGAAFWSWRGISRFTEVVTEMGIDHVLSRNSSPQDSRTIRVRSTAWIAAPRQAILRAA